MRSDEYDFPKNDVRLIIFKQQIWNNVSAVLELNWYKIMSP